MNRIKTALQLNAPVIKKKTAATLTAVVCAVLLPQLVHLCGIMSGTGNSLGEILLPMHLPVMLVGALAGPVAGMAAGLLSPLVSFALTGMPALAALPFMCIELLTYGLIAGALSETKLPSVLKVLITQIGGRGMRFLAMLFSFYALGNESADAGRFVSSVGRGWAGIAIQLILVSIAAYAVRKRSEK